MNLTFMRKLGGKAVMLWKRHGSAIMTVSGCVSTVAGTFFACKATLKVDEVLRTHEDEKARIEAAHNGQVMLTDGTTYSEKDYKKDLLVVKTATAKDLAKLYAPAVLLIGGGIALIGGGHSMMHRELIATAANAAALKKSFDDYRGRVKEKLGAAEEDMVYHDIGKVDVTEIGPGKDAKAVNKTVYVKSGEASPYQRYFDDTNPYWTGRLDDDATFIKQRQAQMNFLFNCDERHRDTNGRKFLFWNEQLEKLGFTSCKAGQVAGNIEAPDTDGFIDYGVFDMETGCLKDWQRDLYNREGRFLIDFNVDGNIIERVNLETI